MSDPYDIPPDSPEAESGMVVSRPVPLRVWSAMTVPLLAIFVSTVFAGVVLIVAIMATGIPLNSSNVAEATATLIAQPIGIWVVVVPGQLVFLVAALVAAVLSPVAVRERLQMSRSTMPVWTWVVFAIGTPAVGIAMSLLTDVLDVEWSEHLELMDQLVGGQSGLQFVVTAILISAVPGFVEEVLFRGYLQSRLLQRWRPSVAIGVSAAIFAIAHIDPLHVALTFPVGVWLGVVAWRTRSIWPAVACHMANNLLSVVMSDGQGHNSDVQVSDVLLLIPCSLAMIASIFLIVRPNPSPTPYMTGPES